MSRAGDGGSQEEQTVEPTDQPRQVRYINPTDLLHNRAFTQVVVVPAPSRTIYIGAQHAVDGSGEIIGPGDLAAQTEQTLKNLEVCLDAAGATIDDLVQWTIYVVQGQPLQPSFRIFQQWWGNREDPPANTVVFVAGFARPEFLVGIDAIATVAE
jgi:enamine deaminase RidA (YjgF/YER057c/UK114 family)